MSRIGNFLVGYSHVIDPSSEYAIMLRKKYVITIMNNSSGYAIVYFWFYQKENLPVQGTERLKIAVKPVRGQPREHQKLDFIQRCKLAQV